MGIFLAKFFIKNHKETKNTKVREQYGKFAGIVGIISNVFLSIAKVVIGLLSHSIAILVDGINNLSDAASSIITLIGFKMSARPEDEDHPYGHARMEYLAGLFVSILIIIIGAQLLRSSIEKVLHPPQLDFSLVTILVLFLAILIKVWQMFFYKGIGKEINSLTLIAAGTDSRNDVIVTAAILISVTVNQIWGLNLDGHMGCLVALFVIWSGIQLVRETSNPLLGEAPDEELVQEIAERAQAYEGVLGIHDLIVHNYGPGKIFASIHIEVDAKGDLMASHDMIDMIEKTIIDDLNIAFVVHMDPVETDNPLIDKLYDAITKTIKTMDGVHSIHDLRIVPGPTHTNIIFDAVLSSGCTLKKDEIKQKIEQDVQKINSTYFVVITFDNEYTKLGNETDVY